MRFYRISSQQTDFDAACSVLFRALRNRGYSERFLRHIKSQTLKAMKSGDLIAPLGILPEPDSAYFATPCEGRFCHTCENVNHCNSVTSNTNKFVFKIRQELNCNSKNLIYLVHCKECDKQYIGQTGRSLRLRTNNHRADIVDPKRNSSVGHHFNNGMCTIEDFSITPIFRCPELDTIDKTNKLRLKIEQYFIEAFKSYLPYGLNVAVKKHKDSLPIHYSVPFSGLGKKASKIVRKHYKDLQALMPDIYPFEVVSAYSRNRNLKDMLVSSKIRG